MKALATLVRLARFKAEALQRELAALEDRRRAHDAKIAAHEAAIVAEQNAARRDAHALTAYGEYARAAIAKRAVLAAERETLRAEAEALRDILNQAFIELKKVETLTEQEAARELEEAGRRDQIVMDDVAANMMRRKG